MNQISSKRKVTFGSIMKGELGLFIIMVALIIIFATTANNFIHPNNLINITRQVSINLIVSIGMLFVILQGELDLSVGSVAALAGIATAYVMSMTWNIPLGMICGVAIGVLFGALNGIFVVFGKIPSFIVTLAMMSIARGIAHVWSGGKPISNLPEDFGVFGAGYVAGVIPVSTIIAAAFLLVGYFVLQRTKHGMYIKAIGANREASRLTAIPVKKYTLISFIICGTLAAVGGILTTSKLLSGVSVSNDGMEMDVISAVILGGASLSGGKGTVIGTLLGALIIGIINNGMNMLQISSFYQMIVKGIIIIAAVLVKRGDQA